MVEGGKAISVFTMCHDLTICNCAADHLIQVLITVFEVQLETVEMEIGNGIWMHMYTRVKPLINDYLLKTTSVQ